jgi:hypothetical protein
VAAVDEQREKHETSPLNRRPFAMFVEQSWNQSETNLDDICMMETKEQGTTVGVITVDRGERKEEASFDAGPRFQR